MPHDSDIPTGVGQRLPKLSPDSERIGRDLEALAEIGRSGEGGVSRLAYTPEDVAAREWLVDRMGDADLDVRVDAFGNIIGRLEGSADLEPLLMGSHIDTPPLGGRFDGTVGVIGALEVVRVFREHGIQPRRPIEVVSFQAEEPGRFGVSCLGSKAMAGKFDVDYLHRLRDEDGVTLYEAIRGIGLDPDALPSVRREPGSAYAYLELHIEQGRVLHDTGDMVGIVTGIAGPTRSRVTVRGQADHSGATPMDLRRDALCAAAELVLALERCARAERKHGTVATVGSLRVRPDVMNIIPGEVFFTVDLRGVDAESKARADRRFLAEVERVRAERGVLIDVERTVDEPPVPCDPRLVNLLEMAAGDLGLRARRMPSGAGHDAQHVAAFAPAGMIFVPCRDGISHAPEEFADIADIARGVSVLCRAALLLCGSQVVPPSDLGAYG